MKVEIKHIIDAGKQNWWIVYFQHLQKKYQWAFDNQLDAKRFQSICQRVFKTKGAKT